MTYISIPCNDTHGGCHIGHTGIDAVKQPGQISDNAADQQPFKPLGNLVPNEIQGHPSLKAPPAGAGEGERVVGCASAEEATEQRNEGGADQGDTAAGHQLYDGEVVVKRNFQSTEKRCPIGQRE